MEDRRRIDSSAPGAEETAAAEVNEVPVKQHPAADDPDAKDLWKFASKQEFKSSIQSKNFIFMGDKGSGKSSIISSLLDLTMLDHPETIALSFKSGVKVNDESRVQLNVYELGGGTNFANLLEAPMKESGQIVQTTLCIVLDLSKPSRQTIDDLAFWLQTLKEQSTAALKQLQATRPEMISVIKSKYQAQFDGCEDVKNKVIQPLKIPAMIIGNKFDKFSQEFDTQTRKSMVSALRYFAHFYGCDLVFTAMTKAGTGNFKKYVKSALNAHTFGVPTNTINKVISTNDPVLIPAGTDRLLDIGEPDGAGNRSNANMDQLWAEQIERFFGKGQQKDGAQRRDATYVEKFLNKFHEPKVHGLLKEKGEQRAEIALQEQRQARLTVKKQDESTVSPNKRAAGQMGGRKVAARFGPGHK